MAEGYPPVLWIEATPAKSSWFRFLMDVVTMGGRGDAADAITKYPEVNVVNRAGERRRLLVLDTWEEAQERASKIADELEAQGPIEWCARNGIPEEFSGAPGSP